MPTRSAGPCPASTGSSSPAPSPTSVTPRPWPATCAPRASACSTTRSGPNPCGRRSAPTPSGWRQGRPDDRVHPAPRTSARRDRIKAILAARGDHPGLVHIFSAMEPCPSFKPWHDKQRADLPQARRGKCLHYYFYFIDPELGLCYLRVPTWAPFRLQFYFNGHNWLARRLQKRASPSPCATTPSWTSTTGSAPKPWPTPSTSADCTAAGPVRPALLPGPPALSGRLPLEPDAGRVRHRHRLPQPADLRPLYDALIRTAIHAVKADHVATFLGRKLTDAYPGEIGNHFETRIQGTRIKHHMGPAAIKMYDKFGLILRIEARPTTSPFSSTTARWNSATAPAASSSRRCARPSTACPTCAS